ncbi:MAG: cell division protein SepF [Candidatus Obscuribacterales bacterium]|nr:cell division protein SepF [Candidatus Obscuribacterales bacterium]
MSDDMKDFTEKPIIATRAKSVQPVVDLFPALADRRMMQMNSMRHQAAPARPGTQISIFSPVSFEEAVDIVECLRSRAATTISLENMKKIDASRLVDFVAGASAALDGDFHKLSEQVYIFCPSNIKITAEKAGSASSESEAQGTDFGALDFLYPTNSLLDSKHSVWSQRPTH